MSTLAPPAPAPTSDIVEIDDFAPDELMPSWITPEEMDDFDEGVPLELVDGTLVEKDVSDYANFVACRFVRLLFRWADATGAGEPFIEATYQCFPGRPRLVRRPDVSFVSAERLRGYSWRNAHLRIAPDLAVEVVSPRDAWYDVEDKVAEYHAAGVPLVLAALPNTRTLYVHPLGGHPRMLSADDDLDGGELLPGFRCRVGELFPDR